VLIIIGYMGPLIMLLVYRNEFNCHSRAFIITEALNCGVSLMFIFIGYNIDKYSKLAFAVRLELAKEDFNLSEELGLISVQKVEKTAEGAKNSLFKMWLIIISLTLCNFLVFLYSLVLFLNP
jgi:hypothetical protein